uniref:Structure-specific endonuclease subunit slx-1 n=1 Tax=Caenorhabditis japonica TaxID=281687 RepID=A0A8R1DNQ8_CAEJA
MYCKMDETFVLSSDSSDGGSPPAKRRSIEGVPSNFDGDRGVRFSFGVANMSTSETIPEEPIEMSTPLRSSSIAIKTPVSLRRRSVSMSSIRRRNGNAAIEPPPKELCSTFVQREIQFHDLSSEDDEANEEDVFVAGTSKKADDNLDLNMRALLSPDKKNKKKEKVEEVQNEFYGVYCLVSRSDRPCYKNRCYIGYTVDPNRRIMQHNGGRGKGGAKKTDSRGPWDMVCVIHGFPNHVAALRFEWAWQNPNVSKCIKELQLKKQRKETPLAYQIRIACELMRSKVFCRFALTFRWLITTEELPFPSTCPPPDHTKLRYGKVKKEFSLVSSKREDYMEMGECRICGKDIEKQFCNNCFQK